jgi:hypothetical protein
MSKNAYKGKLLLINANLALNYLKEKHYEYWAYSLMTDG